MSLLLTFDLSKIFEEFYVQSQYSFLTVVSDDWDFPSRYRRYGSTDIFWRKNFRI